MHVIITQSCYKLIPLTFSILVFFQILMGSGKIVDLDEIVKICAWNFYKKCRKFRQPSKLADIDLVLDWTGVSFDPEDPKYTRIQWIGETKAKDTEKELPEQSEEHNADNEQTANKKRNHSDEIDDREPNTVDKSDTEEAGCIEITAKKKTEQNNVDKKPSEKSKYVTQIIFESVFENNSKNPQVHSLKAERQTAATCTASLTTGFKCGLNVGLTLAAPKDIIKASVGYSEGYSVTNGKETTNYRKLTWTTEGTITVNPESKLTVNLQITEKESEYIFKTKVALKGMVVVKILNRKNDKFLKSYSGDIKQILLDKSIGIDETNDATVFLMLTGKCNFNYGIQQRVVVSEGGKNYCEGDEEADIEETEDE